MGEHGTSRSCVVQRVVGATRVDAELGAQRRQLVIDLSAVTQLAGELECAQGACVGEFDAGAPSGGAQETEIERRIVSHQDSTAYEVGHDRQDPRQGRCGDDVSTTDAVDLDRAER